MNKRDKKLNLKLNRLNEEDENTADGETAEELRPEALEQRNQEIISQEYEFLKGKINKVFKLIPYCEPNLVSVMDSDEKRLEFLNHSLLEHFCSDTEDKILNLANYALNNECLRHFSLSNLIYMLNLTEAESFSSQELFNLNKNLKQTKFLILNSNSFKQMPYSLIDLFENLSLIDLSNNLIDSISLVHLSKFESLRELNLCANSLKSFGDPATVNLTESIFSCIERLNLSCNQLTSDTSVLISQFRNLKYLNLSDNNYLIDEQSQLPWQQMSCNLADNLIELDMSKNNKLVDQVANNTLSGKAQHRAHSVLSTASSTNLSHISNKLALKSFNCLTNLKILNLSENNLVNVPSDIKDLKVLEELVLDRNQIEFVPNELIALKHLRYLSLSGNKLNELSDTFCQYAKFRQSLLKLDLSSNNLKGDNLSFKICLFENLDYLNLSNNAFDLIPNTLPKNLHHLDISNNRIKYLMIRPLGVKVQQDDDILIALDYTEHTSLNKIQRKQKFDMNYDRPETDSAEELLLPHVFYLRNLKSLNVSRNRLTEVPTDFGLLNSNLEYLNMSGNFLTQINTALCRGLGLLKHLDVSDNKLRQITDKIRELTSLEYLNLSHNRLIGLNYELCVELKSLKQLDLSHNYLEELPIYAANQPRTSVVCLNGKKFTFNLTNLEKINLSSNKLKSKFCLYTAVAHCANLIELNLSSNSIAMVDTDEKVDQDIELNELVDEQKAKKLSTPKLQLVHMRSLNLSDNQVMFGQGGFVKLINSVYKLAPNLTEIHYAQPNGLKLGLIDSDKNYCFINQNLDAQALDKLKVIDLSANALTHFPSFILQTKNLTEIYFNNNLIKRIPNEFFKETFSLEDYDQNFKKLEIKAKKKILDIDINDNDDDDNNDNDENNEDDEDELRKKKRRKKKNKKQPSAKVDPLDEQIKLVDERAHSLRAKNYLSERLEILHLNANLIESIPQNFFSYFKCLREIKLNDNPLKDPPHQSVCLSAPAKLNRNSTSWIKTQEHQKYSQPRFEITFLNDKNARPKTSSYHFDKFQQTKPQIQFPHLSSNQDLRPLQSYMLKYKSREGKNTIFSYLKIFVIC